MSISRKKKKQLNVIITVAMVMSFVPVTYAENADSIVYGGENYSMSITPYIGENGLMVSVADMADALSLNYEFDSENKSLKIYKEDGKNIVLMHNATEFVIGEKNYECLPYFYVENGVPMVEIGFAGALIGVAYSYDEETNCISLEKKEDTAIAITDGKVAMLGTKPFEDENGINVEVEGLAKSFGLDYAFDEVSGTVVLYDEKFGEVTLTDGATKFTSAAGEFECEPKFVVVDGVPTIEIGFFSSMYYALYNYDIQNGVLILSKDNVEVAENDVEGISLQYVGTDATLVQASGLEVPTVTASSIYQRVYGKISCIAGAPSNGLDVKLLLQKRGIRYGTYTNYTTIGGIYSLGTVHFDAGATEADYEYQTSSYNSTEYPYYAFLYEIPNYSEYGYLNTSYEMTQINYSPTDQGFEETYDVKNLSSSMGYKVNFEVGADIEESGNNGTCGDNLQWVLYDNGTLTISGEGKMYDFASDSDMPWYNYRDDITTVYIEEGVESIGNCAFYDCTALEKVEIPYTVTSIGDRAFMHCYKLNNVDLPGQLEYLGEGAFSSCRSLETMAIPSGVGAIYAWTFADCSSLYYVTIPDGITEIGMYAFNNCTSIEQLSIPVTVTEIDAVAFNGCPNLTIAGYTNSYAQTYAEENSIPFKALDVVVPGGGGGGPITISGNLSFENSSYINSGNLIATIYAREASSSGNGDYSTQVEISKIGTYPFELTIPYTQDNVILEVAIKGNANTNVYRDWFTYQDDGTLGHNYDVDGIKPSELEKLKIVLPCGKTFSGKIETDRDYKQIGNMVAFASFQSTNGKYYGSTDLYFDGLNYIATLPYGMPEGDGEYTVRLEMGKEGGVNNLVSGEYYYGVRPNMSATALPTLKVNPSNNIAGVDFYVPTGYSVSGKVTIPEDAIMDNASIGVFFNAAGYNSYISGGDMSDNNLDSDNREISFMIGIPKDEGVEGNITLEVYPRPADEMQGGDFYSSVYSGYYYYTADGTLSEDEADAQKITFNKNIDNLVFNLESGNLFSVKLNAPKGCVDSYVNGSLEIVDEDGKVIFEGDPYLSTYYSEPVNFVLEDEYLEKEVYVRYKFDYDRYGQYPDLYTGFAYINPDGSIVTFKKDAKLHKITEDTRIKAEVLTNDEVEIPPALIHNGRYFESEHPYAANTEQTLYYSYEGEIDATQLKVTFSPLSYLYSAGAKLSITDGNGIEKLYDYEYFNDNVSGQTITVNGSEFTLNFTTGHTGGGDYGFAITDIEPVGDIKVDPDDENYGFAEFTVVSAADGVTPVSGANVLLTNSEGKEYKYITDANGNVSKYIPIGTWTAAVVKEGLITRNFDITVVHGAENKFTVGMSDKPLVDVAMSSKVMTLDEIKDAGIDVNAPGNNHVVKYDVTLKFGTESYDMTTYFNSNNVYVGTTHCHEIHLHSGVTVNVYPVSENFYLMVYGEVQWLKEMFDVEMLVMNNSATDTFCDGTAELVLPDGLSLAEMLEGEQKIKQEVPELSKDETHSVHWYVRGDKEGEYNIGAKLKGKLAPLGEKIDQYYTLEEPVKVYAGKAMHMDIYVPDMTFYGDEYPITIKLTNVSDRTLYNVSNAIKYFAQGQVTHWSNGMAVSEGEFTQGNLASLAVQEFKPGDTLEITVKADIKFRSRLFRTKLSEVAKHVKNVDVLLKAYDAYEANADLLDESYEFVVGFEDTLAQIIATKRYTGNEGVMAQRFTQLVDELNTMLDDVNNKKAMDIVNKLKTTGVYAMMQKAANDGDLFRTYTVSRFTKQLKSLEAILRSEEITQDDLKVTEEYLFALIKRAIESIPVKYYLEDVIVSTLEGSTTTIPCTIHTITPDERFFGIEPIDSYLDNIIVSAIGALDAPWAMPAITGGDRMSVGYDELVFVKDTIAKLAATDNMGDVVFKAWFDAASAQYFELSSTNESAKLENGVLTFTGPGYVHIKPLQSGINGTLYVEMNGVTKTYTFTTIDSHTCHSGSWVTVVTPDGEKKGYKVQCCDECGKIVDIGEGGTACANHVYGDYVVDVDANGEELGMKHRECTKCGRIQYTVVDPSVLYTEFVLTEESGFVLSETEATLDNVDSELTPAQIRAHFENDNIEVIDANGNVISAESNVGTGAVLKIDNTDEGQTDTSLTVIVNGDTTGDGKSNVSDLVKIFNRILNRITLEAPFEKAANYNKDTKINVSDLVKLFNSILSRD